MNNPVTFIRTRTSRRSESHVMGQAQSDWQDGQVKVMVNDEGQYALWPAGRDAPPGWTEAGKTGQKDDCLSYISDNWLDMRPLSIR